VAANVRPHYTVISQEVETVLHRSFVSARKAGHRVITVEHMGLEMLREAPVVHHLELCRINIAAVQKQLQDKVSSTSTVESPADDEPDTQPTPDFQRVMQRAILEVQQQHRGEVMLLDLLMAVLEHKNNLVATLLFEESAKSNTSAKLRNRNTVAWSFDDPP
jgi:ATP-dependent Clp protease ATP-binding subunit ClpA